MRIQISLASLANWTVFDVFGSQCHQWLAIQVMLICSVARLLRCRCQPLSAVLNRFQPFSTVLCRSFILMCSMCSISWISAHLI